MGATFELDASEREVLTAERAEVLLEPLSDGIVSVKLSGKSFGDGSAAVAAEALARVAPSLRHLDLSDVIAARPEDEAKRALAAMAEGLAEAKELVSIDLSDNALGAKGIRAIGSILSKQTALRSLKLCNNGLAADAGEIIAAKLTETSPTKLRLLHFHNNLLEDAGAKALAPIVEASPELEDFRFTGLRVHHAGAVRISQALAVNAASLRKVNLADNNFGIPGSIALASALSKTIQLEELVLRDTALGDEGVLAILKGFGNVASHLRLLDLSGNDITVDGARALRKSLSKMLSLETLLIEDNELGSAGAKQIAAGLSPDVHGSLTAIIAAGSEIGSSGASALSQAAVNLPKLSLLNLNGNSIRAEVISDIQELLRDKFGSVSDIDDECDEESESDADSDVEDEDDKENEGDVIDENERRFAKPQCVNGKSTSDPVDPFASNGEGFYKKEDKTSRDKTVKDGSVDDLAEAVDSLSVSS